MERIFYKKLANRIYGYKMVVSAAEYEELRTEVSAFVVTLKDLPVAEAHRRFYEKYGELVDSAKTQELIDLQNKIYSILYFFRVLAVVAIILAVLNIFI